MDISFGLIFGFTVGINYLNFESSEEGEYIHVIQLLVGVIAIEFTWGS